jgi:hypothetical protein
VHGSKAFVHSIESCLGLVAGVGGEIGFGSGEGAHAPMGIGIVLGKLPSFGYTQSRPLGSERANPTGEELRRKEAPPFENRKG